MPHAFLLPARPALGGSLAVSLAALLAVLLTACSAPPTAPLAAPPTTLPTTPPTTPPAAVDLAELKRQVTATETAFAKTMADRDHAAFTRFLADDTVFFSGPTPLRGKAAVAAWWKRFYEGPEAPLSWRPEKVEVLNDGSLALSSGPVFDPSGKAVSSFTSVWRQEAQGVWRIVFDKGCNCP